MRSELDRRGRATRRHRDRADPHLAAPRILDRYEDLPDIDLEAMLAGTAGEPVGAPLYLVCTHGKRDRCRALAGPPTWRAMSAAAPGRVWQTRHLGDVPIPSSCANPEKRKPATLYDRTS